MISGNCRFWSFLDQTIIYSHVGGSPLSDVFPILSSHHCITSRYCDCIIKAVEQRSHSQGLNRVTDSVHLVLLDILTAPEAFEKLSEALMNVHGFTIAANSYCGARHWGKYHYSPTKGIQSYLKDVRDSHVSLSNTAIPPEDCGPGELGSCGHSRSTWLV